MKRAVFICAALMGLSVCLLAGEYPKLVAEWDFSRPDVLTASRFPLQLRKGAVIEDGLLNAQPTEKHVPGGAMTYKIHPELDMKNAFSVVAVFEVDDVPAVHSKVFFDNKYSYSDPASGRMGGFMLNLRPMGNDCYRPFASFGFEKLNSHVQGEVVKLEKGRLHTMKMTFTGRGRATFEVNGKYAGGGTTELGHIAKADYRACIGDRYASTCCHFGRGIAKLSIYEEEPVYFVLWADSTFRCAFERGEKNALLHYTIFNSLDSDMANLTAVLTSEGVERRERIECLKHGERFQGVFPLDTLLLPGGYAVKIELLDGEGKSVAKEELDYAIAPAYGDFLPVALTGSTDPKTAVEYGFTHFRSAGGLVPSRNGVNQDLKARAIANLDKALAHGLYQVFYVRPVTYFGKGPDDAKFLRRDRKGEPYTKEPLDVCNPELIKALADLTEQCAKELGDHPGWDLAVINSEVRDSMMPSFGGQEEENFKKAYGYPIPPSVKGKYPDSYKGDRSFPWDHVLPEDDKVLNYYRWLWGDGDGWNNIHSLVSDITHKYLPHHHTTFFEPAVRNPPKWGSGGRTDTISQWTYTNPDPIKINQAYDEMRAMADEHENQEIFKETQIIWYRNQNAPIGKKVENTPEWVAREPEAKYITIPPDCLREAIWCNASHRVQCLMFHGSGCLFPGEPNSAYRYTNPETKFVFKEMAFSLLRPLGPVIKRIPERLPEVAILESFTSSIYAPGHATSGWSKGWTADLHLALQWAHIQPSVIYEEHLLTNRKLDNVKVILLPGCEVLGEDVLKKLQELQRKGVILIGDEFTLPALMPDIRIESVRRTTPKETKEALQVLGFQIARLLRRHYVSPLAATDRDIILRRRGTDDADYLFVINDKRTFGDYIGPWKLTMEKGLPASGTVTVKHSVKAVYDLVRHEPVAFEKVSGGISFPVELAPGDGRMLLLLNQRIASVAVKVPEKPVAKGGCIAVECAVLDSWGRPIRAVVPVEVTLQDAGGNTLPGTGFYAAEGGRLTLNEVAATNMKSGEVKVTVKDLASGISKQAVFAVQ